MASGEPAARPVFCKSFHLRQSVPEESVPGSGLRLACLALPGAAPSTVCLVRCVVAGRRVTKDHFGQGRHPRISRLLRRVLQLVNLSPPAFAGRMFRLNAVTPVILPTFVRFSSSGRISAKCARVLPFS